MLINVKKVIETINPVNILLVYICPIMIALLPYTWGQKCTFITPELNPTFHLFHFSKVQAINQKNASEYKHSSIKNN
jgi:hypothetical protein